jgi:hypothetical protein
MLVLVVIARENFDSGHFELFNFPGRWLLRPAFLAGIKPCDVIIHKVYTLMFPLVVNSKIPFFLWAVYNIFTQAISIELSGVNRSPKMETFRSKSTHLVYLFSFSFSLYDCSKEEISFWRMLSWSFYRILQHKAPVKPWWKLMRVATPVPVWTLIGSHVQYSHQLPTGSNFDESWWKFSLRVW